MTNHPPSLRRSMGLTTLVFYGVGTIVGGGFYALLGKVAGDAGIWAPLSFLLSGLLALTTLFAYAELSARLPFSGGAAEYVHAGFRRLSLSRLVALMVAGIGLVSAASLIVATGGFLLDLTGLPVRAGALITALLLGAIAAWGVRESAAVVAVITLLETGTLLVAGTLGWLEPARASLDSLNTMAPPQVLTGIFSGAFLAFFAVIGFEDVVNMAEETRDPVRVMPKALFASLGISLAIYIFVSLAAVTRIDPAALERSNTPIALLVADLPGAARWIGLISILAVLNGALVQIIMASRVLYGMASRGRLPAWLAEVHPRTRTPLVATALCTGIMLALALTLPLEPLARLTSGLILVVFTLVNLSVIVLRRREGATGDGPAWPLFIPVAGAILSTGMLAFELWRAIIQ
jgi:APA family basic amino acid/polyamine antiporter